MLFLRLREAVVTAPPRSSRSDPPRPRSAPWPTAILPARPGDAAARGPGAHGRRRRRHRARARTTRAPRSTRPRSMRRRRCWPSTPAATASSSWPAGPPTPSRARWRRRRCARSAAALPKAKFLPALRRGNVFGALDMGLAPGILPGPGQPRRGARTASPPLGVGARPRPVVHAPRSWPPWPASAAATPARRAAALVLLGADPLSDFPDHALAEQALSAGHFVVGGDRPPSQSVDAYADVVLPCAVAHERPGTTTNIEGRVTPARPEGRRARLRLAGLDDRGRGGRGARRRPRGDEPGRPGRRADGDRARLRRADRGRHGLGRRARRPRRAAGRRRGPPATTWSRSTRWRCPASSPSSGRARRPASARAASRTPWRRTKDLGSPPPLLAGADAGGAEPLRIPKADNYTLRLVAGRRLYDAGSSVTGSPSLTPLVPDAGGAGQPLRPRPPRRGDR